MKRFKVGIAAVVAILAMSFTVVSNTGFDGKLLDDPAAAGCFRAVDVTYTPPHTPATESFILDSNVPSFPLDDHSVSAVFTSVDPDTQNGQDCVASETENCCIKVEFTLGALKITAVIKGEYLN